MDIMVEEDMRDMVHSADMLDIMDMLGIDR